MALLKEASDVLLIIKERTEIIAVKALINLANVSLRGENSIS